MAKGHGGILPSELQEEMDKVLVEGGPGDTKTYRMKLWNENEIYSPRPEVSIWDRYLYWIEVMWNKTTWEKKDYYEELGAVRGWSGREMFGYKKFLELHQRNYDPEYWIEVEPSELKLCEHVYPFTLTGNSLYSYFEDEGVLSEKRPLGLYFDTDTPMVDMWFRTFLARFTLTFNITSENLTAFIVKWSGFGRQCRMITPVRFLQAFKYGAWSYELGGGIVLGKDTYYPVLDTYMLNLMRWSEGPPDQVGPSQNIDHVWTVYDFTTLIRNRLEWYNARKVIFGIIPVRSYGKYVKDNITFWNQGFFGNVKAYYLLTE